MSETAQRPAKRQWLGLLVTTLIGIAATFSVGWFQLSRAEKQAALAEQERGRAIRQNLVSVVEEHVLNDKPIELARLARLIDQRRRDERFAGVITAAELIEQAEFNILSTRYLPFERKQALKPVFDGLYKEMSLSAFAPFPANTPNSSLLNELARQIQEGKSQVALDTLRRLHDAQRREVENARFGARSETLRDLFEQLAKDPLPFIFTFVIYVVLMGFFVRNRFFIRRAVHRIFDSKLDHVEAESQEQNAESANSEKPSNST